MLSGEYEMRSKKCAARILECGGSLPRRSAAKTGAQRRHRFSTADRASKAACPECFRGSRRSPKRFGCGYAALGSLAAISTAEFSINGLPMICKFS
jgi:hypothetical protein